MHKSDSSSLLQFLSKPRSLHEVSEKFRISPKFAKYQLQKEIELGKIFVSAKQVSHSFLDSEGKLKQLDEFLFVSRNSPLLAKGPLIFATGKRKSETFITRTEAGITFVNFLPKTQNPTENWTHKHLVSKRRKASIPHVAGQSESKRESRSSFLNLAETKAKLSERNDRLRVEGRTRSDHDEHKSLSHMEKVRLFQALSTQSLAFLDLRGRFGVSKQTVRSFIKRGYLEEVWGPRDIGVRFRLTKKGKKYMKELDAAARFDPQQRKKIVIRLKDRLPQ